MENRIVKWLRRARHHKTQSSRKITRTIRNKRPTRTIRRTLDATRASSLRHLSTRFDESLSEMTAFGSFVTEDNKKKRDTHHLCSSAGRQHNYEISKGIANLAPKNRRTEQQPRRNNKENKRKTLLSNSSKYNRRR